MIPDKSNTEPYLFKVMNIHPGAGTDVDQALWQALPHLPLFRKTELEWLEELLSQFVRRIIRIADITLLSFLNAPVEDMRADDWTDIIDSFLDKSMQELDELQSLTLQPLLLRLAEGYSDWIKNKPISGEEGLHEGR
ncbi:MAG TPA: hypothetical protein VE912_10060 [Bacteroidales bacterium]|nr:hypothetical protein [Bacteroidales bacterium]